MDMEKYEDPGLPLENHGNTSENNMENQLRKEPADAGIQTREEQIGNA